MKKHGFIQKGISLALFLFFSIGAILTITNCSKQSDKKQLPPETLKSETAHNIVLPPQDSLSQIKTCFGDAILQHIRENYNETITDFTLLNDTIPYAGDTCRLYTMTLRWAGCDSKVIGLQVNYSGDHKKSTQNVTIHTYRLYSCQAGDCGGSCQLINSGSYYTCFCTLYGECDLITTIICFFYWDK